MLKCSLSKIVHHPDSCNGCYFTFVALHFFLSIHRRNTFCFTWIWISFVNEFFLRFKSGCFFSPNSVADWITAVLIIGFSSTNLCDYHRQAIAFLRMHIFCLPAHTHTHMVICDGAPQSIACGFLAQFMTFDQAQNKN